VKPVMLVVASVMLAVKPVMLVVASVWPVVAFVMLAVPRLPHGMERGDLMGAGIRPWTSEAGGTMKKSMEAEHLVIVLLGIPKNTAAGWLEQAKAVDVAANAHASSFSAISAELSQLHADTTAADAAQAKAKNKGIDDVEVRNAAIKSLKGSYRDFVAAVQRLCNKAPDAEHARALAAQAGLRTKTTKRANKADLEGTALKSGRVHLAIKVPVKRGARVFYEWMMSTDGGKTWVALPNTNDPFTTVASLTPGTYAWFKYRYTTKNTPSAWSTHVEVLVA
jgi:hypothetical protein